MTGGLINVRKEAGWTSRDVCAKLRGILHTKKVGHTGTLDPEAEGVLVCMAGTATRLGEMLTDHDKEYIAVCRLGLTTDTADLTGEVLSTSEVNVDEATLKACVQRFKGTYEQVPPMYSAIRQDGKRLYELARKGQVVERTPRTVRIDAISVRDTSALSTRHEFTMEVRCSRGTYIRTLCEDIGEALGTGGVMAHLLRTAVGSFRIEDAKTIGEIEAYAKEGRTDEIVLPTDRFFRDYDRLHTVPGSDVRLLNGNPLRSADFCEEQDDAMSDTSPQGSPYPDGARVRIYDSKGTFVAIYRYSEKRALFMMDTFLYE